MFPHDGNVLKSAEQSDSCMSTLLWNRYTSPHHVPAPGDEHQAACAEGLPMRVLRSQEPRLPARNNYMPSRNPSLSPPNANLESAQTWTTPASSPLRQKMMSPYTSPLDRLTTPPIYPNSPPKTPLSLVGLDGDVEYLACFPPKRLPALTESVSAPVLARSQGHPMRTTEAHRAGFTESPYVQSSTEYARALAKRNRMLEAKLEEAAAQLSKERKGRRTREERLAAQAEVARKLQQQGYEGEIRQLKDALSNLEAKYQRGVEQYELRLSGASNEIKAAIAKQQEAAREAVKMDHTADVKKQRERQIDHLTRMAARRMGKQMLSKGWGAWLLTFRETRRRSRMLLASANRMIRPKLLHGYGLWRVQWAQAEEAARVKAAKAEGQRAAQRAAIATQETMRKQAEERAAVQKEQRVTKLVEMAVRRIVKAGLSRGFSGWADSYRQITRRKRMLQAAGSKLIRPKLVASYRTWRDGWKATELKAASRLASMSAAEREYELASKLSKVETELRRVQAELSAARQAALDGSSREVELAKRAKEKASREKEQRVEHLTQMAAKRMGKKELTMGWQAWSDLCVEMTRRKRMLQQTAAKLTWPHMVACYKHWQHDWLHERAELASMSMAAMEAELVRTRNELARVRQAALDGTAKEEEAKRLAEEQATHAKQQRVTKLVQMAVRRIVKAGLSRGFSGWADSYRQITRRKRMLQAAGSKLIRPKLVASYSHWRRDWVAESAVTATMSLKERLDLQTSRTIQAEAAASQLRAELHMAREAALMGTALEAEQKRQAEEVAAAEKEQRVEHLTQMAAKRMGKKELAMGWQAWSDLYVEMTRRKRMLQQAGARLIRPKLAAGYALWRTDWQLQQASEQVLGVKAVFERDKAAMEIEITGLRAELDRARVAALSGVGQQEELRRLAEEKAAREKEQRVEHLTQMAAKRMGKKELAMGFESWAEVWCDKVRQRNLLKQSGVRLTKPKLAHAYSHWLQDWRADAVARATELAAITNSQRIDAEAARSKIAEAEVQELRAELVTARQMLAEAGNEDELLRRIEETQAAEREQRVEHLSLMAAKRLGKKELSAGWQTWSDVYFELTRRKRVLAAAASRLSKPKLVVCYREWWQDWQLTMAEARRQEASLARERRLNADAARLEAVEAELRQVKEELGRARVTLAEYGDVPSRVLIPESGLLSAMKEAAAAEKEQRVEHLTQMAAKRMGKKELAMGFESWAEMALENGRRNRLLAAAAARLVKPLLVATYKRWHADWTAEQAAEAAHRHRKDLSAAHASRETAESDARRFKLESEKALSHALGERDELLKRLTELDGGVVQRELEMLRQLEEEKEKRVTHLAKLGIQRMRNAQLSLGWIAWRALWEAEAHKVRTLKGAVARLTRPKMTASYLLWRRDWELSEAIERSKAIAQAKASGQLSKEREAAEAAAKAMKAELQQLRDALFEGKGDAMLYRQQVEAQVAAEKEQRVEHLTQMAAKRMGKKELAMGWQAWSDLCVEMTRRKRMLQQAGARLMRPKLVACYSHWRRDFVAEKMSHARMSLKERLHAESAKCAATQLELARCKKEAEALANRLNDLDGGRAAREVALQRQLEEERDRRVESLKAVAIRRIALGTLAKGWTSWIEMYERQTRQTNLLKQAAARLSRPLLVHSYRHWRHDWDLSQALALKRTAMSAEEKSHHLNSQNAFLQAETERLREELAACREAMAHGNGSERELHRRQAERQAREKEQRVEHLTQMAAKRMGKKELAMGWQAWSDLYWSRVRMHQMLAHVVVRLQRPKVVGVFVHWRQSWQLDVTNVSKLSTQAQLAQETQKRRDAEEALGQVHSDYDTKITELNICIDEARAAALDYLRQLKLSKREGGDLQDRFDDLKEKWEEMTDEERIARAAKEMLATQDRQEREATDARLERLLDAQRRQLLSEAAEMREGLERQVLELKENLANATSKGPRKPAATDKHGKGKQHYNSEMSIRAEDFFKADENGTNELDFDEFVVMWTAKCEREGLPVPSEAELRTIFVSLDKDGGGTVDLSEYVQWALRDALNNSRGRVLDLFREWDTDGSGSIDKKEFGAALKAMGFPCGKGDLDKIFGDLDPTGDGKLEYNELNTSLRRATLKKEGAKPGSTQSPSPAEMPPAKKSPAAKGRGKK